MQPIHHSPTLPPGLRRSTERGMTIVEAVIAVTVLAIFFVTSTMALKLFDSRAAQNRNTEAARDLIDDYVGYLLTETTAVPAVTGDGADIDGDGVADGIICTGLPGRPITNPVSLIETRSATPVAVVSGTLYWRVQAVGKSYGLTNDTDLMQINLTLNYAYLGKNYYYKAMTFKGTSN